jgi:hypothetical protein
MGIQVIFGDATSTNTSTSSSQTSTVSVSARRVDSAGKGPQIITHVMAYLADTRVATTTTRLVAYLGRDFTTNAVTLPQSATTPQTTGFVDLTSTCFIANGSTSPKFGYTSASTGRSIIRYRNSGGTIYGGYEYIQAPSAPQGFGIDSYVADTFQFSWSAPADDGGSPITGYNVYQVSGTTYTLIGTTTETTFQYTLVTTGGTSYQFVVRAKNLVTSTAGSDSVDSNTATYLAVVLAKGSSAKKPFNGPVVTASTSTTVLAAISAHWTIPTIPNNSGSSIIHYTLQLDSTEVMRIAAANKPTSGQPLIISPATLASGGAGITLLPGAATYSLTQLKSVNVQVTATTTGTGARTSNLSSAVYAKSSGVPTAPLNFSATASTIVGQRVTLSWSAPADTGGGLTFYALYKKAVGEGSFSLVNGTISSSVTTFNVDSLTPDVSVTFFVVGRNAIGDAQSPTAVYGAESGQSSATPIVDATAPAITPVATVAGRLQLDWGTTANSTFTIVDASNNSTVAVLLSTISPKRYVIDGLDATQEYSYYVQQDSVALSLLTASNLASPFGLSIQTIRVPDAVTNTTNGDATNGIAGTYTILANGTTNSALVYAKATAPNVAISDVISASAVANNLTNTAIDGSYVLSDTTTVAPHSVTYDLSGTAFSKTTVPSSALVNTTNLLLNSALTSGVEVTAIAEGTAGGAVDYRFVTYTQSLLSTTTVSVFATSNVVTINTPAHTFVKGQSIVVSGLTDAGLTAINGQRTITSVTSTTIVFTVSGFGSIGSLGAPVIDGNGKIELEFVSTSTGGDLAFASSLKDTVKNLSQSAYNVTGRPITAVTDTTITYTRDILSVATASRTTTVATLTFAGAHGLLAGDTITVYGLTGSHAPLNGDQTVTGVSGSPVNTLTYTTATSSTITGTGGASETSGRVKYRDASEAAVTGVVENATNRDVFNSSEADATIASVPDYRTITYPLATALNSNINIGGLTATITNVARTTTSVTATTSAAHNFLVGDTVTIAELPVAFRLLDGTYVITGVPSTTTFTYTTTTTGALSGATATGTATTGPREVEYLIAGAYPTAVFSGTKLDVKYRSGWLA